jgi:hypothetical protein
MSEEREPRNPVEFETEVVNLEDASIANVEAEVVHIRQGGANQINASMVSMRQGGALTIQANEIDIHKGVTVISNAGTTNMDSSSAAVVIGDEVVTEGSRLGLTITNRAKLENSSPIVLLARDVEGSVEPVLDTQGALLAGIVTGITVGAVLLIGNLIRRR